MNEKKNGFYRGKKRKDGKREYKLGCIFLSFIDSKNFHKKTDIHTHVCMCVRVIVCASLLLHIVTYTARYIHIFVHWVWIFIRDVGACSFSQWFVVNFTMISSIDSSCGFFRISFRLSTTPRLYITDFILLTILLKTI